MRFLIDQNVSSKVADLLGDAGHDAIHVATIGMRDATDADVLDRAASEGRVIVTGTPTSGPCSRKAAPTVRRFSSSAESRANAAPSRLP